MGRKVCKKMSTTNFQHSQLEQASIVSENNFPHSHNRNSFLTSNNGDLSLLGLLSSWVILVHQRYFLLFYSHLVFLANFALSHYYYFIIPCVHSSYGGYYITEVIMIVQKSPSSAVKWQLSALQLSIIVQ